MRNKYISLAITLLALAITSVLNIAFQISFFHSVIRLLIVFIIFFIIGKLAERIIVKAIKVDELAKLSEEELEKSEESTLEDTKDTI